MTISNGDLTPQTLAGEVVVVTGGGGGIGYEAARALVWLGARVIIAEINAELGQRAEKQIAAEFGEVKAVFIPTDVGSKADVRRLQEESIERFDKVDAVLNNATIAPLGAVQDVPIEKWDASYTVNLRGPVLLIQAFLPGMLDRGKGVIANVSSTGQQFMGAYEIFKSAQVDLANTLYAEVEGTGVCAYTIGPGLVFTQTASAAVKELVPMMGMTMEQFHELTREQVLSAEAAGAGFAASIALAQRYCGQEISSMQALMDAGILLEEERSSDPSEKVSTGSLDTIASLAKSVHKTLDEQSSDWKHRSIFERQWLLRAFRQRTGMPPEQWLEALEKLREGALRGNAGAVREFRPSLPSLADFYSYLYDTAKGYLRDPGEREEYLSIVDGWREDVLRLLTAIEKAGQD